MDPVNRPARIAIARGRQEVRLWPVVTLLFVVVLLPTACVVWLVFEAMGNERLAVRQRMQQLYTAELESAGRGAADAWREFLDRARLIAESEGSAPARFAGLVRRLEIDGAVIFDESGAAVYPEALVPVVDRGEHGAAWAEARAAERGGADPGEVAAMYGAIADGAGVSPSLEALALQGWARSLVAADRRGEAVTLLVDRLGDERFAGALDPGGRHVQSAGELRALQLMGEGDARFGVVADRLAARLRDYSVPIPSSQRRFLMAELVAVTDGRVGFAELAAERLAARWVDGAADHGRGPPAIDLTPRPSPVDSTYQVAIGRAGGAALLLISEDRLRALLDAALEGARREGVVVELLGPGRGPDPSQGDTAAVVSLGGDLPGWRAAMRWDDAMLVDPAAERRRSIYLIASVNAIATAIAAAVFVAWTVRRQVQLARLKNDLVATVSHELKTPLSSMRLLTDTLIERPDVDAETTREYLSLIAAENKRLSRLIDNFLTFSRLQRGVYQLHREPVHLDELVAEAAETLAPRFAEAGGAIELHAEQEVPVVRADGDAVLTILLNLLDNAYKYGDQAAPRAVVRVGVADGMATVSVSDRGIGMSPSEVRRAFDRFYQADHRSARHAGGCGLGLSIVKRLVDAHGGRITVDSERGRGTTVTFGLPLDGTHGRHARA